jgi:signal transduction histidine kinase
VRLSLSERSGQLVLELQDRGPGLPPGLEDRLFDRFVRGQGSASKGAGLGLALVKEVIERHGGTVRAENREGGGARFELRLPLLQPGEDAS